LYIGRANLTRDTIIKGLLAMNLIPSYDNGIMMIGLKMMAAGLVVIVGYIILDNHFTSKEFPDLTFKDSLANQRVSSISKNRSVSYAEFQNGQKRKIPWGQNWNYEDFQSIAEILSIGDLVSKKANSDTIKIMHSDKEYVFVLEHAIEKSK
jgi:hypothetical protein